MSSKHEAKLDWCSHAAAKYAVTHWHYSGSLPPPMMRVGVWEQSEFIGCILFARGASSKLLNHYGLQMTEGCELVRIALNNHATSVSRLVAIAVKSFVKSKCPALRLVVSFADLFQGHHGGIYQAGGWIYAGTTAPSKMYRDAKGKLWHSRMIKKSGVGTVFGKRRRVLTPDECEAIAVPGKHRYLLPLDNDMRKKLAPLRKQYPKRERSADSGTLDVQSRGGSASLTRSLSSADE